jgi:membrane-associated phospholipid phosphatase
MPRRPQLLLALAAASGLAAALVYALAVHVGWVEQRDLRVLVGFTGLRGARTEPVAHAVANAFNPAPYAVLCAAAAGFAVLRGKWRYGLASAIALLGANVTTQLLKSGLQSSRPAFSGIIVGDHAWPSGHTTAVMTLTLAVILVSPAWLRPLVAALGGLVTVAVVYSILLLGWHYPSDVAGGFFVATAWFFAAVAGLKAVEPTAGPVPAARVLWPPLVAGVIACAVASALVAREGRRVLSYADGHTTFVAGAAILGGAAVVLAGVVAVAASTAGREPGERRRLRRRATSAAG